MMATIFIACCILAPAVGFQRSLHSTQYQGPQPLHLFDFLKGKGGADAPPQGKVEQKRPQLEKISNKQNRDWAAESKAAQPKAAEVRDKQVTSFNFGKADEFPNLYKGWIRTEGDQIGKQIIAATSSALKKNERYVEVLIDPVPNLDEVAFGTVWNKKFAEDVVKELKVPAYAANRGGPSTLEWSNLYWASRIAQGALKGKNVLLVSLSGEGTKGNNLPTFSKGTKLVTLQEAKRSIGTEGFGKFDALILLSPCQESHYKDGQALADKLGVPVVALNSPYSYRYDVGGGAPFSLAYVMKRIPKGWFFRQYPKPFEAIIEGPNYDVFKANTYPDQPKLTVVSKDSMVASSAKYGRAGNDRIFQSRL
ncbi:hypothetical protein B484DRAFT_428421 [Ochromonadaceae sp. CCMP2298]|nr:hypothetical protein B484DRAFT_428421 [Ochromonadaceae sp. CCMP2298]